jgi:hypothetical protein
MTSESYRFYIDKYGVRVFSVNLIIREGVHYEALLTTTYRGSLYVAPVGFSKKGGKVYIKVYKGGTLEDVVKSVEDVVLLLTFKPELYTAYSLKEEFKKLKEAIDRLLASSEPPRLPEVLGYVKLRRVSVSDEGAYYLIVYEPLHSELNDEAIVEPYTRCYPSIIEMLIYATKIVALMQTLSPNELRELLKRVEVAFEISRKTCSEEYVNLASEVYNSVMKWAKSS